MPTVLYKTKKKNESGDWILKKDGTERHYRVPSVTTICREFENEEGLCDWYFKQGKEGKNPYKHSKYARGTGTLAHKMAENFMLGADIDYELCTASQLEMHPDDYPGAIESATKAFTAFQAWWEINSMQVEEVEISLACDEHMYGGTPDIIGSSPAIGSCIVDLKTKDFYDDFGVKKNIWLSAKDALQLGAYAHLWENGRLNESQGSIRQFPPKLGTRINGFVILYISRQSAEFDGVVLDREIVEHCMQSFLRLRQAYEDKRIIKSALKDGRERFRSMFLA